MKLHNVDFVEAVHMLADRANIEIEDSAERGASGGFKARLRECCASACSFFENQLQRGKGFGPDAARKYLGKRKFGSQISKDWHLGYAPGKGTLVGHLIDAGFSGDEIVQANLASNSSGGLRDRFFNRVIFPIFDTRGNCVAFGGRVIGSGEPKYLNSSETPIFHKSNVLFGIDKAKNEMIRSGCAVVVEGYTDVIAMHVAGIQNVVATLGTALTQAHLKLLNRYASTKIIYLFDGDEAGIRAAERALQFIDYSMTPEAGQSRCDLYAVTLPDNLDPAEFIDLKGGDAMKDVLDNSRPLIEFGISRRMEKYDISTPEGRSRALVDCISILAPIKDSILAKDYAASLASRLRVSEQDAQVQLAKLKNPKQQNSTSQQEMNPALEVKEEAELPNDIKGTVERNRLANEREVVSISALFPQLVLECADSIEQIVWKSGQYKMMATLILEQLSEDLSKSSKQILAELSDKIPESEKIITAFIGMEEVEARDALRVAIYSCLIEDCKERVEDLNLKLASGLDIAESRNTLSEIQSISEQIVEYTKMRIQ